MERNTPAAQAAKNNVSGPVLIGLCHFMHWVDGDMVTETEFLAAHEEFMGMPLGGHRVEE